MLEIGGHSNPVSDSIRHDWAVNAAEVEKRPYSTLVSRMTWHGENLPAVTALPIGRLIYTRKGHSYVETRNAAMLARKLETIRCDAELFLVNERGLVGERIGGCERANSDDRRFRWAWWYDRGACGLDAGMYQSIASGSGLEAA